MKTKAKGTRDCFSLTIYVSPTIADDLDTLVKSERFGIDAEAVAKELLLAKVRELVLEGWLKR